MKFLFCKLIIVSVLMLCVLTSKLMLANAWTWSKKMKNTQKSTRKYLFHFAQERLTWGSHRKTRKKVCWSAIGSDPPKLVDTQKLVAYLEFCCFHCSSTRAVCEPPMHMFGNLLLEVKLQGFSDSWINQLIMYYQSLYITYFTRFFPWCNFMVCLVATIFFNYITNKLHL